jgi:hypothetical protein
LSQPARDVALDAYDWIFTDRSLKVFEASSFDIEKTRCFIRKRIRAGKLLALEMEQVAA